MRIKDAKWEMTDDAIGMQPKFQVICTQCAFHALMDYMVVPELSLVDAFTSWMRDMIDCKFDMFLREVHCTKLPFVSERAFANNMHYKCCHSNGCDQVKVFGVPIDEEYYTELMKRRAGNARIVPREDWDKDEDIKKQLKGLGYI